MAETKKPAAKSAAVKKTTAASKPTTTEATVAEVKPAVKKVSKGNKKPAFTTRLQDKYNNEIKGALMEKFNYSSIMEVPHLEKIIIKCPTGSKFEQGEVITVSFDLDNLHLFDKETEITICNYAVEFFMIIVELTVYRKQINQIYRQII